MFVQKFHFLSYKTAKKKNKKKLKHEVQSNLQVYELPTDASQKQYLKYFFVDTVYNPTTFLS